MSESFDEDRFRRDVDDAMVAVRRILATTKSAQRAADVPHTYDDKFALAESAVDTFVEALGTVLEPIGASASALKSMRQWAREKKSITLSLNAEEHCSFIKKRERDVEDATKHVTEWESGGGSSIASTVKRVFKRVTRITEWLWKFTWDWELIAYGGADPKNSVKLLARSGTVELITSDESSPRSEHRVLAPRTLDITWVVQRWDATAPFKVDRGAASCHTPRRNADVEAALRVAVGAWLWADGVAAYFNEIFPLQKQDKLDMSALKADGVFLPITPLLLAADEAGARGAPLPPTDRGAFVAEAKRSLDAKLAAIKKAFANDSGLITTAEASLVVVACIVSALAHRAVDCVNYVEFLIEQQLVAAVGKVVQPKDFAEYMQFHARRLFKAEYAPKPFVYAIRRPDHCPEGELTIDADVGDGSLAQPLHTLAASAVAKRPWYFALGAASRVAFYGERHLHGGVLHKFANESDAKLQLTSRARQFSSFVLLVGKIASADTFEPTHAMIVQNKDDVIVPLALETIPSAKAFKEAIQSMSPEQQRFAKMFRAMQLESTLFGVCIVQIKPQLEKLLNLPYDALTKEIRLTQDLMDLFIQYQIPSDLLAYDGKASAPLADKIAAVKRQVDQVQRMIQRAKSTELEEVQQEAAYAVIEDSIHVDYDESYEEEECDDAGADYDMEEARESAPQRSMSSLRSVAMKEEAADDMPVLSAKSAPAPKPVAPKAAVAKQEPAKPAQQPAKKPADTNKPDEVKDAQLDKQQQQQQQAQDEAEAARAVDFTKVPSLLDERFGTLTDDGAVCATKIEVANEWRRKYFPGLLAKVREETLDADGLGTHKNKAFDLLDALTKSGGLSIELAELHCVILSTHCFVKSALHTITRDNLNPIEKVEATQLIVASALHGCSHRALVRDNQLERVATYSPKLFAKSDDNDDDDKEKK